MSVPVRSFPMLVLPISKALTLDEFPKHEDIKESLVEYQPGSTSAAVVFFSHTWLSWKHPDGAARQKWGLVKGLLQKALSGELEVVPHWAVWMMAMISGAKWRLYHSAKAMQKALTGGYIWVDFACVPQENPEAQARAIASLSTYVSDSSFFVVLAGAWEHTGDGSIRDLHAWNTRGWCRLEQAANALSPQARPKPLIVAESTSCVLSYGPGGYFCHGWFTQPVGCGNFTVDADRAALAPTLAALLEARKVAALSRGTSEELAWFRVLEAATPKLMSGITPIEDNAANSVLAETATEAAATAAELSTWLVGMRYSLHGDPMGKKDVGPQPLHAAVLSGRMDLVVALLDGVLTPPADVNCRMRGTLPQFDHLYPGSTPLHCAMHLSHDATLVTKMVALLLRRGANAALKDKAGQVALHKACAIGNLHAIRAMLTSEAGRATLLILDPDGLPPPFHSLEVGQVEAFVLLRDSCPEIGPMLQRNRSDLNGAHGPFGVSLCQHLAMIAGNPKMMELLLDAGCSMDKQPTKSCSARTALGCAHGFFRLLGAFHVATDLVRMSSVMDATCLHMAVCNGHLGAVRLLLARGADLHSQHHHQRFTALHVAACFGHAEIASALVSAGASLDARDVRGRTAAYHAARRGHTQLARQLEPPADVATQRRRGARVASHKYRVQVAPAVKN